MGLLVIRKKNQVFGAKRFGKIGTAGLDFGILALILFPGMPLFSIEFVDSGIDDFNGCYLDFVSSVPYRITHR